MNKSVTLEQAVKILEKNGLMYRGIKYAAAKTLNDLAYQGREEIQKSLQRQHIIRQPGLIRAKVRYNKTVRSRTINGLESSTGSISDENRSATSFTGWLENELGMVDDRKRKWFDRGRVGKSEKGKVRAKYRFKPGREIPSSYGNKSDLFKFVSDLRKRHYVDKPFMITESGYKNLPDGVYILSRKKPKPRDKRKKGSKHGSYFPSQHYGIVEIAARKQTRIDQKKPFLPDVYKFAQVKIFTIFKKHAEQAIEYQLKSRR